MGGRILRRTAAGRPRRAADPGRGILSWGGEGTLRLTLLQEAPALWLLGVFALAILATYGIARRRRTHWAPVAVRILSAAGLVLPAWTILVWYRELSRALEWSDRLNVRLHAPTATESVTHAFLASSMALLTLGFILMVVGIFLAHRLDGIVAPDEEDRGR